jgi:hypothetical protein
MALISLHAGPKAFSFFGGPFLLEHWKKIGKNSKKKKQKILKYKEKQCFGRLFWVFLGFG